VLENELKEKFKKIFAVRKVTFDNPGESQEQECLFIEIEDCKSAIKDGVEKHKVTGNAVFFANADKMPLGYFSKRIKQADHDDTKDLFFFDFESNSRRNLNIVQRGFSFVYFSSAQYDPKVGEITSIDLTTAIEE